MVTTISSNDSANASRPPATSAVARFGRVMNRNVCQPSAPRSIEASSNELDERRRRATALLKTTTMQKVEWPTATVTSDGVSDRYSIAESSDNPVTMPGSAIGSTSSSDSEFFPKKR